MSTCMLPRDGLEHRTESAPAGRLDSLAQVRRRLGEMMDGHAAEDLRVVIAFLVRARGPEGRHLMREAIGAHQPQSAAIRRNPPQSTAIRRKVDGVGLTSPLSLAMTPPSTGGATSNPIVSEFEI